MPLDDDDDAEVRLMTGNEAIARGAVEAGVSFATAYPGTPSSEVLANLARMTDPERVYVEWSTNEKVAFEAAYAASLVGARAMAVMKHLGTHWIVDPLAVAAVAGTRGGLVVVSADDPYPHSSQSSVDTRLTGRLVNVPVVEPSDPAEAKSLLKESFKLSEELELPVLFRYTTRVAHSKSPVPLEEPEEPERIPGDFERDPERFVSIAPNARKNIPKLIEKIDRAAELLARPPFVVREGASRGEVGLVASGVPYLYALDAMEVLGREIPVLKVSLAYPLPPKPVDDFLSGLSRVLVLEEMEPVIEDQLIKTAYLSGRNVEILGKSTGATKRFGETDADATLRAVSALVGMDAPASKVRWFEDRRIPQMCAGCPHRGSYLSIKRGLIRARRGRGVIFGDRGCYNQGANPPLEAIDTCIAMGASIAMAAGAKKAGLREPAVAVIGDSTFFHGGIPPLIDAVEGRAPIVVAILDNRWTCMTGHQPSPTTGKNARGEEAPVILPEDVVRSLGVGHVEVVDAYDLSRGEEAIFRAVEHAESSGEPAVVVFRGECVLQVLRRMSRSGERPTPYEVVPDKCVGCRMCVLTGCPAISFDLEESTASIEATKCTGCGVCAQVCPTSAIVRSGVGS